MPARAVALASHKAVYDIKLVSSRKDTPLIDIRGKMSFEVRTGCTGWVSNHQIDMIYQYADNPPLAVSSKQSTFEAFDGKTLSFSSKRDRQGSLPDITRGEALINPGKKGFATYAKPHKAAQTLAPGTLFPMSHTKEMIERARKGVVLYNAILFDGDDDGPFEVSAVIAKHLQQPSLKTGQQINPSLLKSDAWRLRLAFFKQSASEDTPDYEIDATLQDNGVIRDMMIEYPEFKVAQTLISLVPLKEEKCGNSPDPRR